MPTKSKVKNIKATEARLSPQDIIIVKPEFRNNKARKGSAAIIERNHGKTWEAIAAKGARSSTVHRLEEAGEITVKHVAA